MLIGLVIGTIFAVVGLSQSFPRRHEPEPPNSRWKLPSLILIVVTRVTFAVAGPWPVVWVALAVVLLVEIGYVLAGRNPWWMQGDRRGERSPNAQ
jgi:sterol desaturase/sphingolipid hydroxylase (fatty acid hydroxylase superfamily)